MPAIDKKAKIRKAVNKFKEEDRDDLLSVNTHEVTLEHRIAVYLEEPFIGYHVDCEYSKHGHKKNMETDNSKMIKDDNNINFSIRPDIIIHKTRGNDDDNVAIIEIKKCGACTKAARNDIDKLKACISGNLNYKLGVFIGILKRRIDIVWIEIDSKGNIMLQTESA